jgi:uncharacterized protein YeaO (DUF488 family)
VPPAPSAPEARPRPRLHYIFVYPFRRWTTGFDEIVLADLLTNLSSKWEEQEEREEQGPVPENAGNAGNTVNVKKQSSRGHTFSLRYTDLSWKTWAEVRGPSITFISRVRSTLVRWKEFAEKYQMEVLDGYGVDIRDVAIPSEGLDDLKHDTPGVVQQ